MKESHDKKCVDCSHESNQKYYQTNLKLETLYSEWYSADSTTKIKIKQDMLREWKDFKSENISDLQIKFWFNHDIMKNEQKTIN